MDTDYGTFRRKQDYSDSISVYYTPEANYTYTFAYSIKLQRTREATPGFLRELHFTRGTYSIFRVPYNQRGYAYTRPTLGSYSNMKE